MYFDINNVKPGMVLAETILNDQLTTLLSAPRTLTETEIALLIKHKKSTIKISFDKKLLSDVETTLSEDDISKTINTLKTAMNSKSGIDETGIFAIQNSSQAIYAKLSRSKSFNFDILELGLCHEDVYMHALNVCQFAISLAKFYNEEQENKKTNNERLDISDVASASILHNIGKLYEGNNKEFAKLKSKFGYKEQGFNVSQTAFINYDEDMYPVYSHATICGMPENIVRANVKTAVLYHKENEKGTGNLKNKSLNSSQKSKRQFVTARIINLCDQYIKLIEEAVIKKQTPSNVIEILKQRASDLEVDGDLFKLLCEKMPLYSKGTRLLLSNGTVGTVVSSNSKYPDRPIVKCINSVKTEEKEQSYETVHIDLSKENNLNISRIVDYDMKDQMQFEREKEVKALTKVYKDIVTSMSSGSNSGSFLDSIIKLESRSLDRIKKDIDLLSANGFFVGLEDKLMLAIENSIKGISPENLSMLETYGKKIVKSEDVNFELYDKNEIQMAVDEGMIGNIR